MQSVVIGDGENKIVVTVIEWRESGVRIGIEAPSSVPVHREEVYNVIKRSGGDLLIRQPEPGENVAKPPDDR